MPGKGWRNTASRLVQMGGREFLDRSRQAMSKRADAVFGLLGFDFSRGLVDSAKVKPGCFFFAPESVRSLLDLIHQRLPQPADHIIRQADAVCRHRFDLLGYENLDYGHPINWHLDAVHGKQAPKQAFYKIRYLEFDEVGDCKVTWELNRHQHFVTLAKAYLLTDDRRYADQIFQQWQAWHGENPYARGINWASSLEVAFRTLSWIWMYHLLEGTPVLPPKFREQYLRAQALNGRHIERYLSTYFSPNTHLLGEAVALFFLGALCPELTPAARWKQRGWELVLQEARRQVQADGFHFEQSTYYHVYALDFFLHAALLAQLNGMAIPHEFEQTLGRMCDALWLLGRCGTPPRLGDDDGGRLFDPARNRDEHLLDPLSTGAAIFHRGDYKDAARSLSEETIWLLGEQGVAEWDRVQGRPPVLASASLSSAGLYLIATPNPPSQFVVRAGPQGAQSAGHGHADALSICLHSQGRALLIDPGTLEYVGRGPERDRFRCTGMHNSVTVDGKSQSEPAGPFAWKRLTHSKAEHWISGETFDFFLGTHDGYSRLATPVTHHRWIVSLKSGLTLVRDVAHGMGQHRLDIAWHLGPDMHARGEHLFGVKDSAVGVVILGAGKQEWTEEVRGDEWSPAYGRKEPATVLNFGTTAPLPTEFGTLLIPFEKIVEAPGELKWMPEPGSTTSVTAYVYSAPSEEYLFLFGETGRPWNYGQLSSDAAFLCWKRQRHGEGQLLFFCNGSYVEIDGRRVVSSKKTVSCYEMLTGDCVQTAPKRGGCAREQGN
jgi:hypothetical protein